MESDLDLDFQGQNFVCVGDILVGKNGLILKIIFFCIYKIYSFEIFSYVNLLSVSNQFQFKK